MQRVTSQLPLSTKNSISGGLFGRLNNIFGCGEQWGSTNVTSFQQNQFPETKEFQVFSGALASHWFLLDLENRKKLYGWGRNLENQLNQKERKFYKKENFVSVWEDENVINSASCGAYHSNILLENNKIVSFGENRFGELGISNSHQHFNISSVFASEFDINLTNIHASTQFSIVKSESGDLFGWGRNNEGQLGFLPSTITHTPHPVLIPLPASIKEVSLGWGHCLAICENEQLYSWGANMHGQLGAGFASDFEYKIQQVCLPDPFELYDKTLPVDNNKASSILVRPIQISAGGTHSLLLTESVNDPFLRFLFIWGSYKDCKLGIPEKQHDVTAPTLLSVPPLDSGDYFRSVSCGCDHSIVLSAQGRVYGWGFGQHGTLGIPSRPKLPSPSLLQFSIKPEGILCSSDDTLFRTVSKQ